MREITDHIARGDLSSAEAACREFLSRHPGEPRAGFLLAFVHWRQGRCDDAIDQARRILESEPNDAGLLSDLGNLLRELGAFDDALTALDRSLVFRPGHSGAVYNRALVLDALGREGEAIEAAVSIPSGDPLVAKARYLSGRIRKERGDMSGAEADFTACTLADPRNAAACHERVLTRRFASGDPVFELLKERLATAHDADSKARLLFALAKIHDDIADYGTAAGYLEQANSLVHSVYDGHAIERRVDALREQFPGPLDTPGLIEARPVPLFIVGLPRSGTTLLEVRLGAHPAVAALGERVTLPRLLPVFDLLPGKEQWAGLARDYLSGIPEDAQKSDWVTDKMPENFWRLGHIANMFGGARVIHCRREMRDVALSNFFNFYETGNNFSYRMGDMAHYAACHDAVMEHWFEVLPGRILEVRYEDFVSDTKTEMERIADFLGLDGSRVSSSGEKETTRRIRTASNWQVRQGVYATSVDRWKNYPELAERFSSAFERFRARLDQ